MSIRQRLLLWLLVAALIAIAIAGLSIYQRARTEANHLFDYHLKQIALTLQDHVPDESDIMGSLEEEIDYDFVIQVWSGDGEKHYLSHPHKALPPQTAPGYQWVRTDEGEWRTFAMIQNHLLVQVSQPTDIRKQLATKLAMSMLMPAIVLLLVLGCLIWFIVGRGMRPLELFAADLRASDAHVLKPISPAQLPSELQPLAISLNDLLERLDHAMKVQREFIADAAHELRTPLTALQLQAQLAERATTPAEQALGFAHLKAGLKRATHLVQQLLSLARHEAGATVQEFVTIDLSALVNELTAQYRSLALAKEITVRSNVTAGIMVRGDSAALRIMFSNVIDNAIQYTPERGDIQIQLSLRDGRAMLEVSDSGPGIPVEDRQRVFDRFYRVEGGAGMGSGLGLAIVKRIADAHGVDIVLANRLPTLGLRLEFVFPKTDQ